MEDRKRYVIVGTGARHEIYRDAICGEYKETALLAGLCDKNPGRAKLSSARARDKTRGEIPVYSDSQFDEMIEQTRPDCVIVTTKDSLHDVYICRAMELGCDVVTEKPMTIDACRCKKILNTREQTGRSLRVTFNYRYSPLRTQIRQLLHEGIIGQILSMDFHWMLDTRHGADYFRRWHRNRENSGGLLVHKATHHFDLVNWWLSSVPEKVYAAGRLSFYLPETACRLGLRNRAERCLECAEAHRCPYYLSLKDDENLRSLYLEQEQHDRYYRDRCVFSDNIDIEDTMVLAVAYANGATMSYSLNAYMPWEGYMVVFNGTRGRLEHKCEESVNVGGDGSVPGALSREGSWIRVYPQFESAYEIPVWTADGAHGGGDELLLRDIFIPQSAEDPYERRADHNAGKWSIMTGIAANLSIQRGEVVPVRELLTGL